MKNFISLIFIYIFFIACSGTTSVTTKDIGPYNELGYRWIDMTDIISLINFSNENKINTSSVLNMLGEPVLIERYVIDDIPSNILSYRFKSKLYPISEITEKYTIGPFGSINNESQLISKKINQIKPESQGEYEKWDDKKQWLLVVVNENYFEIILPDVSNIDIKPKINRDLIFESKKFNKNLIKDLNNEGVAKSLLEAN